jgi:hypothetical protein
MMSEQVLHRAGQVLCDVKEIFHGVPVSAHGVTPIPQETENQFFEGTTTQHKITDLDV